VADMDASFYLQMRDILYLEKTKNNSLKSVQQKIDKQRNDEDRTLSVTYQKNKM